MLELPHSVAGFEPRMALHGGEDGLKFYRSIAQNYAKALKPGGYLCFEFGMGQGDDICQILLDNGCKYSAPGSQVTLSLRRHGRKKCLLTVESRGETLTAQECRDIFKRFYRRDPNRSMNHSHGLGLAIAQTVVHQHKGEIWATGSEGINTFHVCLHLKR